ncbi:hypothetical protein RJ639_039164 [Escallonia herrerae]|uniref:Polyprotein n=1 Tax=Escallonia herrerae TaxID=1293975 RepID=A0AA89BA92_9ASTE|nr:hypothetical protein RJ639_039164 [Escallonia herrerae]
MTADAGVVEDNSDGVNVLLVTISSSDGRWILDTSCSYHMCPNMDWFATYHSFDGGKVLMGNDVACKVVEIGSFQIRMHDGIVRTLIDVRHIPELRKNLISLGTLDSNGCSSRAAGGVMRIMKGALVVMKGLKQNNLYLLQGSTVTGAAATTSSSDIDSDTTKLWHVLLRHMSDRDMDVLSKQDLLGSKKIGKLDFCEHCVFGKQCRVKFSRAVHTTKDTVDYIHLDLPSKGCGRYIVTFIDDFSRKVSTTAIHCKTPEDGKLEPRAKKCIFLEYANVVKGYRLWCSDSKSSMILISRDVTFDESSMLSNEKELLDAGKDHGDREKVELEVRAPDSLPIIPTDENDGSQSSEENEEPQEQQYSIARNRPRREIRPLHKYGYANMVAYALWQRILSCKWIYKKKEGIPRIEDARYKARLVAQDFTKREGIDYNEIFSPVVKHTSIRVLLAMVAIYDLELEQLDVKTIFLHEAEYIATTEAVKEAIWLKGSVGDLGLKQESSTVYYDSQSAIHLTKNQMFHERTKHIDVRFHFIRDVVSHGTVMVEKISTDENPTGMMAKHIPEIKFKHCLDLIGINNI